MERRFGGLQRALDPAGRLWVCWPKKASRVPTDLTFGIVQEHGLSAGLSTTRPCRSPTCSRGASSSVGDRSQVPDAMPGPSHRMNRPVVAVLAVAAIAGVIRYAAIDDPRELVFDETYAKAGCIQVDARP